MSFERDVNSSREEKDSYFMSGDSPVPENERGRFTGLKYFPPDQEYRVIVKLQPYLDPQIVTLTTNKGTQQKFHRVGWFDFEINRKKVRLQAYRSVETEDERLFVPFRDRTSGRETYGSGRYMDLEPSESDSYMLDFNAAYNPFCAYSDSYVCPFPPKENSLDVEIRAGEKKYHD